MLSKPNRGDIWVADLEPVAGHEQGGKRPCLILSADLFNHGPADLVVVLPVTSRKRDIPLRVKIEPPEAGIKTISYVMPEMIRSISIGRLHQRMGSINTATMAEVELHVRALLRL